MVGNQHGQVLGATAGVESQLVEAANFAAEQGTGGHARPGRDDGWVEQVRACNAVDVFASMNGSPSGAPSWEAIARNRKPVRCLHTAFF